MNSFIGKIFHGQSDELVHLQFQKFSRGSFRDRALVKASKSAKGYSVSTTAEYANDLVRAVAHKLGSNTTAVNGVVVSTLNLKDKLPSTGLKQFMGIKQYVISGEMKGTEIIALLDSAPDGFFALTFNAGDTILKIKPKAPKSAKPSTSEKGPKVDFCSLKTTDESLVRLVLFDAPATWKSIEINHTLNITDIEIPTNAKTPEEMRKFAKRKGTIVRKSVIDGKEHISEKNFVA
jgi:hypothetical protein